MSKHRDIFVFFDYVVEFFEFVILNFGKHKILWRFVWKKKWKK